MEFASFHGISTFPRNFAEFHTGRELLLFPNSNQSLQSFLTKLQIFLSRLSTSSMSKTALQRQKWSTNHE